MAASMCRMFSSYSKYATRASNIIEHKLPTTQFTAACIHTTQTRAKNLKSKKNKAPHIAKETQKWVRGGAEKVKRFSEEKVYPVEFLTKKVVDDVWFTKYYMEQQFSLERAIDMHKEISHPDMLNTEDELIYLNMRLDMRTKKQTKFLKGVRSSILFPHLFDDEVEKKLLAFCKTDEETKIAKENGAKFAGGSDIIRQARSLGAGGYIKIRKSRIEAGEIDQSEFDYCVSTMDIVADLVPIRHVIKEVFPNKARGTLGTDIGQLVDNVIKGHHYESKRDEFEDESMLTVPFGKLDMPTLKLVENASALINQVRTHKPSNLGHLIKEIYVLIPYSKERFLLDKELYRPGENVLKQNTEEIDNDSDDDEVAAKS